MGLLLPNKGNARSMQVVFRSSKKLWLFYHESRRDVNGETRPWGLPKVCTPFVDTHIVNAA